MHFEIPSFAKGSLIPPEYCLGVIPENGRFAFAPNRNPHLRWSDLPPGTKSCAIVMYDPDVPSVGTDVNQEGRLVSETLPRCDFFHWVLVDIPTDIREIPVGAVSDGVVPHGKPFGQTPFGLCGVNDYTGWFSGNTDMEGYWSGYDGPCPPWNDLRLHHYRFRLYALNIATLGLTGPFTGAMAMETMSGHIIALREWCAVYTMNPTIKDML